MGGGNGGGGPGQDLNVAGGDVGEGAEDGGLRGGVPDVEADLGHGDPGDEKGGTRARLIPLMLRRWFHAWPELGNF